MADADLREQIDWVTRRLLHTSMHNRIPIFIAGRVQDDINELRVVAGLTEFVWGDYVLDEEVGRCTVHSDDECAGQHTGDVRKAPVRQRGGLPRVQEAAKVRSLSATPRRSLAKSSGLTSLR